MGGIREAILFSLGANANHGLRRTNRDKRRAVLTLLNDEEWTQWSNLQIAKRCGVDEGLVRKLRPECQFGQSELTERKTVNKHGQETTRSSHNSKPKPKPQPEPDTEVTDDEPTEDIEVETEVESAQVDDLEPEETEAQNEPETLDSADESESTPIKPTSPLPSPTTTAVKPEFEGEIAEAPKRETDEKGQPCVLHTWLPFGYPGFYL